MLMQTVQIIRCTFEETYMNDIRWVESLFNLTGALTKRIPCIINTLNVLLYIAKLVLPEL